MRPVDFRASAPARSAGGDAPKPRIRYRQALARYFVELASAKKKLLDTGMHRYTMEGMVARTVQLVIRFTPKEAAHIRAIVKANSGTVSEFVRMCVNTGLAQQGDPEAARMLTEMLEKGMRKFVHLKVAAAMREKK